jgi:acyl carrier protein
MMTTEAAVSEFILEYLQEQIPGLSLRMTIRELGVDSLEVLELILSAEERFQIEVDADGVEPDMTLDELCKKIGQSRAA